MAAFIHERAGACPQQPARGIEPRRCVVVLISLLALVRPVLGQQAAPCTFEEFRAAIAPLLPTEGTLTAEYRGAYAPVRAVLSYDNRSGAFFNISLGKVRVQDTGGNEFGGMVRGATVVQDDGVQVRAAHEVLGDVFTHVLLKHLVDSPSEVARVDRGPDGSYTLLVHRPKDGRRPEFGERTDAVTVSSDGRITRTERLSDGLVTTYRYSDESPRGCPVPAVFGSVDGWILERVRFEARSDPSQFEIGRVCERAVAERTAVDWSSARPEEYPTPPFARRNLSPDPSARAVGGRYRWPLIGTGIVFIAVACIAWYRRYAR